MKYVIVLFSTPRDHRVDVFYAFFAAQRYLPGIGLITRLGKHKSQGPSATGKEGSMVGGMSWEHPALASQFWLGAIVV